MTPFGHLMNIEVFGRRGWQEHLVGPQQLKPVFRRQRTVCPAAGEARAESSKAVRHSKKFAGFFILKNKRGI